MDTAKAVVTLPRPWGPRPKQLMRGFKKALFHFSVKWVGVTLSHWAKEGPLGQRYRRFETPPRPTPTITGGQGLSPAWRNAGNNKILNFFLVDGGLNILSLVIFSRQNLWGHRDVHPVPGHHAQVNNG